MRSVSKTADCLTMESLALPRDLYWDGKMEPTSPLADELFAITEPAQFWLGDDNFLNEIATTKADVWELKPGMEILSADDVVIEFYDLKEDWSDNKLSLLEPDPTISPPNPVTKVTSSFNVGSPKPESSDSAILTTLTPPQSPPQSVTSPTILQHIIPSESPVNFNGVLQHSLTPTISSRHIQEVQSVPLSAPATPLPTFTFNPFYGNPQCAPSYIAHNDDDKRNSEIVDEFLKSCIKELPNFNDNCESLSSSSSICGTESIATDEWLPDSSFTSSAISSPDYRGDEDNSQSATLLEKTTKKRTRPYGRGIEDRKIRKKEQNKNAATRYRQKKKLEMEIVLSEEQKLTMRNEELKRTLEERKREAKYLKTLIKEFYRKKGQVE